jgi:hypothetical protein
MSGEKVASSEADRSETCPYGCGGRSRYDDGYGRPVPTDTRTGVSCPYGAKAFVKNMVRGFFITTKVVTTITATQVIQDESMMRSMIS